MANKTIIFVGDIVFFRGLSPNTPIPPYTCCLQTLERLFILETSNRQGKKLDHNRFVQYCTVQKLRKTPRSVCGMATYRRHTYLFLVSEGTAMMCVERPCVRQPQPMC